MRWHPLGCGHSKCRRPAIGSGRRSRPRMPLRQEDTMPLLETTREGLLKVATSTLTGILNRRGLRNMFMQDVNPLRITQARMVGIAFTMRFIPSREDKTGPNAPNGGRNTQVQAMEECPP